MSTKLQTQNMHVSPVECIPVILFEKISQTFAFKKCIALIAKFSYSENWT